MVVTATRTLCVRRQLILGLLFHFVTGRTHPPTLRGMAAPGAISAGPLRGRVVLSNNHIVATAVAVPVLYPTENMMGFRYLRNACVHGGCFGCLRDMVAKLGVAHLTRDHFNANADHARLSGFLALSCAAVHNPTGYVRTPQANAYVDAAVPQRYRL